jgi:dihydrolipoamide dehydrogenase
MDFQLAIIGSGPGGYVAAIRAAQLGLKTAIIEKYGTLGGTCLNVGCIPSKALLDSSEHYHNATHNFQAHGISLSDIKVDMNQMIKRKNDVVEQTTKGVDFLMKKNKIKVYQGHGTFVNSNTISIQPETGEAFEITAEKVIIATGSKPVIPDAFNYDKKRVISSTEALNISKVPKKMVVIGGGVIGLELGSVFARLGTEVEVVEFQKAILPEMDKDCSKVQKRDSDDTFELTADYCLVSIGRRPYTDNLGLDKAGVKVDDRGRVEVNDHLQTNVPNIYAIGDVVRGAMLAHKAEEEGIMVVEQMAGQKPHINYNLIPGVVYTWPEVAAVGETEEQLKERGVNYKVGKFPFKALGRARASMDTAGMVKILADETSDEILGVHMVGPRCADMIAEVTALMEFRASAEDLSRICHAHPTFTEAIKEAALAATDNRPLHI